VLTISIPEKKKKEVIRRAKKSGKTVSAYIISVLDWEEKLISEDELVEMIKEAKKEHREGKTKLLRSHKDLM
jgi:uncharacterized protein involved in tolerance to divalent cations